MFQNILYQVTHLPIMAAETPMLLIMNITATIEDSSVKVSDDDWLTVMLAGNVVSRMGLFWTELLFVLKMESVMYIKMIMAH